MAFNLKAETARKSYYEGLENSGYGDVIAKDIESIMAKAKEIIYAFEDEKVKAKCADYTEEHKDELIEAGFKVIDDMFENTNMNSSTYRVARALLRVADAISFDGSMPLVKISNSNLMAKAKIKSDNTLRSSPKWLSDQGLLEVKKVSKAKNSSASYILHFDDPLTKSTAKNEVLNEVNNAEPY